MRHPVTYTISEPNPEILFKANHKRHPFFLEGLWAGKIEGSNAYSLQHTPSFELSHPTTMSSILLSFDLGRIPMEQLPLFMAHAAKLDMLYRQLAGMPGYEQPPPAEDLPQPSFDEEEDEEKTLEEMTGQELRDRLADLTGKKHGIKSSGKFPTKADLIAEIRRLQGPAERKVEEKEGSLFVTTATGPEERRMSEDSLQEKKPRKSRWEGMTPEQIAEEKAKIGARLKAGREAAKAKKAEDKKTQ